MLDARCSPLGLRRAFLCPHPSTKQQTKRRQPSPAPHEKHQPPSNTLNRGSPPPPHTQNIQPSSNALNRGSPPPPQFARHGAHTKPPRIHRNPGGTAAYPEYRYTQRCIYPLPRHQGVRALRGRVPCRSKEDNMHLAQQNCIYSGNAKIPPIPKNQRDFLSSAPPGTRTQNPLIKSQLLCQLS